MTGQDDHSRVWLILTGSELEPRAVSTRNPRILRSESLYGHKCYATDRLTLARPDCLVSVNGQSAAGLGGFSGLPQNPDPLANRYYEELLNWVYEQPWFNEPQPDDPLERTIWNSRAALLDAFVYEGDDV